MGSLTDRKSKTMNSGNAMPLMGILRMGIVFQTNRKMAIRSTASPACQAAIDRNDRSVSVQLGAPARTAMTNSTIIRTTMRLRPAWTIGWRNNDDFIIQFQRSGIRLIEFGGRYRCRDSGNCHVDGIRRFIHPGYTYRVNFL
jgi:hypothetical protein